MTLTRYAKFAWGVLAWNLLVIIWGAFVRASGSGAGCGDHWPLCNGELIPRPEQLETLIEFAHRITSGVALIGVGALVIGAWRTFPAGHRVRKAAGLSGLFIIVEALLGAGLVLLELVAYNVSIARAYWMAGHLVSMVGQRRSPRTVARPRRRRFGHLAGHCRDVCAGSQRRHHRAG
jgi:cytochrome c oxidase assembly protein subunit 15/protoheme IX farnesyltransferase